jgi:hypothetical protein
MAIGCDGDPAALSLDERISAVGGSEREIARLQARQALLVAAVVADPCVGSPAADLEKVMVTEEVRAVLGESAVSVGSRIVRSRGRR